LRKGTLAQASKKDAGVRGDITGGLKSDREKGEVEEKEACRGGAATASPFRKTKTRIQKGRKGTLQRRKIEGKISG